VNGANLNLVASLRGVEGVSFVGDWAANDSAVLGFYEDDRPPHKVFGSGQIVAQAKTIAYVWFVTPSSKIEDVRDELNSES
jgi:hypothetical protein